MNRLMKIVICIMLLIGCMSLPITATDEDTIMEIKATLQITTMKIGTMTLKLDDAKENFIILNSNDEKLISINLETGDMIVWSGDLTLNCGPLPKE